MRSTVHGRDNHSCSLKLLNSSAVLPSLLLLALVFAWDMCGAGAFPLTNNRCSGELCMLPNSLSVFVLQYRDTPTPTGIRSSKTELGLEGFASLMVTLHQQRMVVCLPQVQQHIVLLISHMLHGVSTVSFFITIIFLICLSKTDFEADIWERVLGPAA